MPPQRADAAHIAPYLTHLITHHGQVTLVPPDNNGRRRKAKENKSIGNQPREEPVRFNSDPRSPSSSGGPSRRAGRPPQAQAQDSEQDNDPLDDIPDYPPPSFQEAISSPPVSVCPSTTTLGNFTAPRQAYNSDSDSESDDGSLDGVDSANLPPSRLSTAGQSHYRSQAPTRGRGILDSDPDDFGRATPSLNQRPQRRHLSLSPLRTLFPSRNARESRILSAQSTPSPHSLAFSRSSPFFRSTTSLHPSSSPLFLPHSSSSAPSIRSENLLSPRRFFSLKGKERAISAREALDSWEIVDPGILSDEAALPSHSQSPLHEVISISGPVANPLDSSPTPACEPRPPEPTAPSVAIHPLSERDRQVKSSSRAPPPPVGSPARERERRAPPSPSSLPPGPSVPVIPGAGPPVVTVRTKKAPPPPPPKRKAQPVPSPLRGAGPWRTLSDIDLERAVQTPLPLTPVAGTPISPSDPPPEPASTPSENHVVPPRVDEGDVSEQVITSDNPHVEGPLQHHYPGRPLPRRPRVIVDSTYAPHPDFPQVEVAPHPPQNVPEGLLIDLEDTDSATAQVPLPQDLPSISPDLDQHTPTSPSMQRMSSASSVDLVPAVPRAEYLEVTDLDVLLARLEGDQRDGGDYDALWMVSEFIGPASPAHATGTATAMAMAMATSTAFPSDSKVSSLLSGHIEVQRRRTTKDGRVKLKLALLGTAVDRCGICMTQFKKAERARMSEGCKHAFHDRCLTRWVARSRTCPLCRIALDLGVGGDMGR